MSNTLSTALFSGTLAYTANQYMAYRNGSTSTLAAPISILTYPLLERIVSFVSKNYLPENIRILMVFTATIFATRKIIDQFEEKLTKLELFLDIPIKVKEGFEIQKKYVAITSVVLLTLFIK